jgi:hypothetical protein
MMDRDCQNVFAALSQYIDRDLPDTTCDELERHIQGCAPCVEFVESLKKSINLGRGYKPEIDAPQISPEVRESLRAIYSKMVQK